jgi:hypothetical protein
VALKCYLHSCSCDPAVWNVCSVHARFSPSHCAASKIMQTGDALMMRAPVDAPAAANSATAPAEFECLQSLEVLYVSPLSKTSMLRFLNRFRNVYEATQRSKHLHESNTTTSRSPL